MVAIQDQVIPTRNYLKYIVKDARIDDDKCRRCGAIHENIQHILSGCGVLAQTSYKARHDNVGKIVHQSLLRIHGLENPQQPYYRYTPESVIESRDVKIFWDRTILTDNTVAHNRPDIVIHDKIGKTVTVVDFAVVDNNNLDSTYATKIQKYTALSNEVKAQWGIEKVKILPVVLSTTGLVPKHTIQALEHLQIPRALNAIQKAVVLDSCRIVREFLNM